jgi:hypothetical protein
VNRGTINVLILDCGDSCTTVNLLLLKNIMEEKN